MLDELRRFNQDAGDLEELVTLHAFGSMVKEHFENMDVDVPEWLEPKLRSIKRKVQLRTADLLEKKISDVKNRLESFKTPAEKKVELLKQLRDLEKQAAGAD